MKQFLIAITLLIAGGVLFLAVTGNLDVILSAINPGFTDNQIKGVEDQIRADLLKRVAKSSSAVERQEVANGLTTVDVHMVKVSKKRLEGYATISINTPEAKDLGLDNIQIPCEATLGVDRDQYVWKCQEK